MLPISRGYFLNFQSTQKYTPLGNSCKLYSVLTAMLKLNSIQEMKTL